MTGNSSLKKSKCVLVRMLPSVYDECKKYNLDIPQIMRRGLVAELNLHKYALNGKGTPQLAWADYDDKTMSFKDGA